jgi:hypothetical protein
MAYAQRTVLPYFALLLFVHVMPNLMFPLLTDAAFKGPGGPDSGWLEYILTHYRGYFCLFFLLPLPALFEVGS